MSNIGLFRLRLAKDSFFAYQKVPSRDHSKVHRPYRKLIFFTYISTLLSNILIYLVSRLRMSYINSRLNK